MKLETVECGLTDYLMIRFAVFRVLQNCLLLVGSTGQELDEVRQTLQMKIAGIKAEIWMKFGLNDYGVESGY